jgi:hypothetical protein
MMAVENRQKRRRKRRKRHPAHECTAAPVAAGDEAEAIRETCDSIEGALNLKRASV